MLLLSILLLLLLFVKTIETSYKIDNNSKLMVTATVVLQLQFTNKQIHIRFLYFSKVSDVNVSHSSISSYDIRCVFTGASGKKSRSIFMHGARSSNTGKLDI